MISPFLTSVLRGIESLVFDNTCLICGSSESQFCDHCRRDWNSNPRKIEGESFPVYASIPYTDKAKMVLLSAKENGEKFTTDLLVKELKASIKELLVYESAESKEVLLVPIPSSRRTTRRRGIDFISTLTKAIEIELNSERSKASFRRCRILSLSKEVQDQSGLSESQRHENLRGAFQVVSSFKSDLPIVVVDDVITTGSTLREAVRALKERNLTVLGAATACASQRRLPIR